jgi:hypothetical protein
MVKKHFMIRRISLFLYALVPNSRARVARDHQMAVARHPMLRLVAPCMLEKRVILRNSAVWSMKICILSRDTMDSEWLVRSQTPLQPLVLPRTKGNVHHLFCIDCRVVSHPLSTTSRPCIRHQLPHKNKPFSHSLNPHR